jgi:hypothetical protein
VVGGVSARPERGADARAVPEDDFQRDEVVLARLGVVGVVVVAAIGEGEVWHLREVDCHLRRGEARIECLVEGAFLILDDDAAVVSRNALAFEQFEVERAHRAERRAFVGDGVGHLPPVEHGVGVGEDERPAAEFLGTGGVVHAEVLDAGHTPGVECGDKKRSGP